MQNTNYQVNESSIAACRGRLKPKGLMPKRTDESTEASKDSNKRVRFSENDQESDDGFVEQVGYTANSPIDSASSDEENGTFDKMNDETAEIEPFNLKREKEEGKFDSDGHYSWNLDEFAYEDNWLEGISGEEIKKAKKAN